MKTNSESAEVVRNRALEIGHLYQKQMFQMIGLVSTHSKLSLKSLHSINSEDSQSPVASNLLESVTQQMAQQVKDNLAFAESVYHLGFVAHSKVASILQQQVEESCALTAEVLKSPALHGNPISSMALAVVKSTLDASHTVMKDALASASKSSDLAKESMATLKI